MSISALIRRMSELGASAEAIAAAVEAIEVERARADEERAKVDAARAAARDRKRRQRAGQSRDSHGTVTAMSRDSHAEPPSPVSPKDNISNPLPTPSPTQIQREREAEFVSVFWPEYPHKVGKPVALKSYISARNRASAEKIMAGLRAYVAGKPAGRDWLNPATFLNQDRFDDAPATVATAAQPRAAPPRPDPQEIRNPALRALQRLSQKNAQRPDSADIFANAPDAGQRAPSDGGSSAETGFETGGNGPILNLAAYR